jgi:S1-C subfamily serine protease
MNKNYTSLLVLFVFLVGLAASASAAPLPASAQNLESLTKKVFPSVVRVEARNGWRKVATGVVIDKDGYIVTTALVSPRDAKLFVISSDGEEVEAEFLGMDPETHLALIKAKDKKWKPIAMGRLEDLSAGLEIAVVCFSPEEKAAITKGIVSSVGRDSLRLNVVVIPGASGSPVIDMQGRMIGLVRGAY